MIELIGRREPEELSHSYAADWLFFSICLVYAIRLCAPLEVFPPYFFPNWLPQFGWGLCFFIGALIQLFGLRVGETCVWAPVVRGIGTAFGVMPLTMLAAALFYRQPYSLKICDVAVFTGIGFFCLYRAGKDRTKAVRNAG